MNENTTRTNSVEADVQATATEEKVTATETKQNGNKSFTQDEVNAIVQKRLAEEKGKAQKQQQASEDLNTKEQQLLDRENKLQLAERQFTAKSKLKENNLPDELAEFLDLTDDDTMTQSIEKLSNIIRKTSLSSNADSGIRIDTGLTHGTATATTSNDDFTSNFSRTPRY